MKRKPSKLTAAKARSTKTATGESRRPDSKGVDTASETYVFPYRRLYAELRKMSDDARLSHALFDAARTAAALGKAPLARLLERIAFASDANDLEWLEGKGSPSAAAERWQRRKKGERIARLQRLAADPKHSRLRDSFLQSIEEEGDEDSRATIFATNRAALLRELAKSPAFAGPSDKERLANAIDHALSMIRFHRAESVLGLPRKSILDARERVLAKVLKVAVTARAGAAWRANYMTALLRGLGIKESTARDWVKRAKIE